MVALSSRVNHLKYSLDSKSGNARLGSKIIFKFENLINLFESLEALEKIKALNDSVNQKLEKISELVNNNRTYKFSLLGANMLEKNDFDLSKTFKNDEVDPSLELSDLEKRAIKIYLSEFSNNFDMYSLETKYFATRYNDLTFLNKIHTVMGNYNSVLERQKYRVLKQWKSIQKDILEVALNAKKLDSSVDLDELVRLASYEGDTSYDLSQSHKMKVFKKRAQKNS